MKSATSNASRSNEARRRRAQREKAATLGSTTFKNDHVKSKAFEMFIVSPRRRGSKITSVSHIANEYEAPAARVRVTPPFPPTPTKKKPKKLQVCSKTVSSPPTVDQQPTRL